MGAAIGIVGVGGLRSTRVVALLGSRCGTVGAAGLALSVVMAWCLVLLQKRVSLGGSIV